MLRAYLRDEAPARERAAAKGLTTLLTLGIPCILVMGPFWGWRLTLWFILLLCVILAYGLALLELLGRGWYHPAIPWMNSLVEVSLPVPFLVVEASARGGEYALTSPVGTLWTGLVVFSAIRADPRICISAGITAAVELLTLYYTLRSGGPFSDETLRAPWMFLRAFYMAGAGVAGALVARSLVRKAEDALRAVREQDLMGKYFLHERLGVGGMAEVFRATYSPEGGFQKTVAIKRILPGLAERPHFTELFLDEARLCALLSHPNVVQVLDVGKYRDTFILAMEYVDGVSLQTLLTTRRLLPVSAVAFIAAELGAALSYLHTRIGPDGEPLNLVHRDVNPPNVLISRFGEVKLGDFGIAHAATLTTPQDTNHFVGKNLYAAPEQRRCEAPDFRADLFALGLTLYEALTGKTISWDRLPNQGKSDFTNLIPPPSFTRREVPPELDEIIMGLLQYEPVHRTSSGLRLREQVSSLNGPAAPFPYGQKLLAREVHQVMAERSGGTATTLMEDDDASTQAGNRSRVG